SEGDGFVVSYTGNSRDEAKRVTAKLTDVLIGENTRLRAEQAEVARAFLDAEKKRNEDDLAAKEAEQLRFLAKHPEFAHEQSTIGVTLRATKKDPDAAGNDANNAPGPPGRAAARGGAAPPPDRQPAADPAPAARSGARRRQDRGRGQAQGGAARAGRPARALHRAAPRRAVGGGAGQGGRGRLPAGRRRA